MTLGQMLTESARNYGDSTAVIFNDQRMNYEQLNQQAAGLAWGLIRLGVRKGDRVAVLLGNCPAFFVSYFAILKAGGSVVPLNTMLKEGEISYILKNSGSRFIICSPVHHRLIKRVRTIYKELENIILAGRYRNPFVLTIRRISRLKSFRDPAVSISSDDVAAILYTSGTTGSPKGAMLTHCNLLSNVDSIKSAFKSAEGEVMICVLPLFHAFAATVCMLFPLATGSTVVIRERFSAREVLESISKYRVTIFVGVPPMYAVLANLASPAQYNLSQWWLCISGGAALPVDVMMSFEQKYGIPVYEGDGPTECSPVTSVNPIGGLRKPGSIGLPVPGVEMSIVDEDGNNLAPEKIGEITVRGPNVMKGYLNDPQATALSIRGGWFHTGDIGKKDRDGYFYILDRKKDMVNVAGMNVYPREVEEVLYKHPEVAEAAVIGVIHDGLRGEIPKAIVVVKDGSTIGEKELIQFCQSKLAKYKVPKFVEFRKELPKTSTGKILKRALK